MASITVRQVSDVGRAISWATNMILKGIEGGPVVLSVDREKRSNSQNSKLWPMLTDISEQVEWFGKMHNTETWKAVITGTFQKCEILPNLDGDGFVMIGLSTSKMKKALFSELIEYIYVFGADKNVVWSEKSLLIYAEYRENAT